MHIDIYPLSLGIDRCYILKGEGVVMIDGGAMGKAKAFLRGIKKMPVHPEDITLLILTHGHFDHIGSAKDIKELTGAKIAMHEREKDWLELSLTPLPPGVTSWGKLLGQIIGVFMPFVHIPATTVDLVLDDREFPLDEFGIAGKIISTPGHSPGSVSVVLETGEAFVGDLAMNAFPLRLNPGFPIFANDMQKVRESWKMLLEAGAKMVYPAHGSPFPVEKMGLE